MSSHDVGAMVLVLAGATGGCSSCEEAVSDLQELCEATPSTANLVSIRNVDFDEIGDDVLLSTTHNVNICQLHFPANTAAGHQFIAASSEVSRIEGSALHFTRTWVAHKGKAGLYPASPGDDAFDYVDNAAAGVMPCHDDGSIDCGDWVMNTCRFDGSWQAGGPDIDQFTIGVNSYCYDHFTDPTSDDHPYQHGILHELAHGFGMGHTDGWAEADKKYISTMQGNQVFLTALDVAYLRERYPAAMAEHRNYVAGSKTRFDNGDGTFDTRVLDKDNPLQLYVDGDQLKDCATDAAPTFYVAWFNTGDLDGEDDICGVNRISLRDAGGDAIELVSWRIATMPALSQDQWQGTADPDAAAVARIDVTRSYDVVFTVNALGTLDEATDEDNELTYPVELFASSACN